MNVAVLGLGHMGQALADRLLRGGHDVIVWNRSKGKAGDLLRAGGAEAASVGEAVAAADVVVTMLSNDQAVRDVALGPGGVHASVGADTLYVDSSTVSPALSGELADTFPHFVAMPILGSPEAVKAGQARYLVGGLGSDTDRLTPVLQSLSSSIGFFDRAPLATCAKVTSNLLLLAGVAALAEAFAVGRAGGLTDDALRELLGQSPLVAPALKNRFEAVLSGSGAGWWATALGAKDAGLAVDLAAPLTSLPVAIAVRDVYLHAASAGMAEEDIAAVSRLYRSIA